MEEKIGFSLSAEKTDSGAKRKLGPDIQIVGHLQSETVVGPRFVLLKV